jgi:hypothetical protein
MGQNKGSGQRTETQAQDERNGESEALSRCEGALEDG